MRLRFGPVRDRRGFVLLAVLSVMVGAVALGAALAATTAAAIGAARNRGSLTRASWLAEGCLEYTRAIIDEALLDQRRASRVWSNIDSVAAASPLITGCDVTIEPAGMRLDANSAGEGELRVLFRSLVASSERADSLADALLDWRDPDDEPRLRGAEHQWYEREHRPSPRNGAFASRKELALVRGLGDVAGVDTVLGVEHERIWLDRAPLAVITTMPGMTTEAIARINERRQAREPVGELAALADMLSPKARDALLAHYAELVARTTTVPEAWMLTARAAAGSPAITAALEVRLVRAGSRAAIVRRRGQP
jgi:type II secretory pathway component PulK